MPPLCRIYGWPYPLRPQRVCCCLVLGSTRSLQQDVQEKLKCLSLTGVNTEPLPRFEVPSCFKTFRAEAYMRLWLVAHLVGLLRVHGLPAPTRRTDPG